MLGDTNAVATLAVKDLGKAARFYEETLGLSRAGAEDNEAIMFESGDTTINVYRSSFAGTNNETGRPSIGGNPDFPCQQLCRSTIF